ncbi:helix-turn-helix domain-containing protein [Streptomyces solincola]|uniref:helix-turn-helix domain-containing protein n=1 Tax=Streptomyces solincola TaxID=2100817 RepID=UPI0011B29998|nr:helix-turn-helix transcriptional regulator [Streptomyces solincola]
MTDDEPMYRHVAEKILRTRPEEPMSLEQSAHVDPIGSQRRAQALVALGFTGPVLAVELGFNGHVPNFWRFFQATVINATRRDRIAAGYTKLQYADPADFGVDNQRAARLRNIAKERAWAPPSCWDSDTIDDPEAIPEWTGACGTPRGRYIHERDKIRPVCKPCARAAREAAGQEPATRVFSPDALAALLANRGWLAPDLSARMGLAGPDSVYRWLSGKALPSQVSWDLMASTLGVTIEDLEA